jgi:hypothetical protein
MGLVSRRRQLSNGPCTSPHRPESSEKIFQIEHEIFTDGSSNLFRRGFCIGTHLAGGRTVNVSQLDIYCQILDGFVDL